MYRKFYGYYTSPIGPLKIVTSEDALLSVRFVSEVEESTETSEILKEAIEQIDEYFKGTRKHFDLEFELEGTDFQKSVWKELLEIPYGKTASYKDVAIRIGKEKAIRAVGGAVGANRISIAIPCHRVISDNGSLTGYSGGLHRKKWLLEHEKRHTT